MKRIAILLAALLFLSACDGNRGSEETSSPPPDAPTGGPSGAPAGEVPSAAPLTVPDAYFLYPQTEIKAYTVDENGTVYFASFNLEILKDLSEPPFIISAHGLDGNLTNQYRIFTDPNDDIAHMCVDGGKLYFSVDAYRDNVDTLCVYDTETRELEQFILPDSFEEINKIAYLNGKIYILGKHREFRDSLYDPKVYIPFYTYDGTVLASYDLESGELEFIHTELTQNFALTPYGTLLILYFDSVYRYTEYDPETRQTNFRAMGGDRVDSFASDGTGVLGFRRSRHFTGKNELFYYTLNFNDGEFVLLADEDHVFKDGVMYAGGLTFILKYAGGPKLIRVDNSAYIKDDPVIRMINSNVWRTTVDVRAGYRFAESELNSQEIALKILSREKDYDVCCLNSRQDIASNIKEKGSFYPLNDVPGVREYIDACFPFVRDAATDKDGNIWMIPTEVNIDAIIYNGENCENAGLGFQNALTYKEIIDIMYKARAFNDANYSYNPIALLQKSKLYYIRDNTDLDTPGFREMAQTLKNFYDNTDGRAIGQGGSVAYQMFDGEFIEGGNPDFLFSSQERAIYTSPDYIQNDALHAIPIAGAGGAASAYSAFLCVNPYSDNLEYALEYISALCEHMLTLRDSCILSDLAAYTNSEYAKRLHAMYQNAVIDFNVSDEVFADDFDKYLKDEITLDQLVKEAGRKLAMYLGE